MNNRFDLEAFIEDASREQLEDKLIELYRENESLDNNNEELTEERDELSNENIDLMELAEHAPVIKSVDELILEGTIQKLRIAYKYGRLTIEDIETKLGLI